MSDLLTLKGQQYARYIYLAHTYTYKIPWLGKYLTGIIASVTFATIIKEGAAYHVSRKSSNAAKIAMPGMRYGVSSSGRETAEEVRELQFSPSGVPAVPTLVERIRETSEESGENHKDD